MTPDEEAQERAEYARPLTGAPRLSTAALRRHVDAYGPYMVAETARALGLKSPVSPADPPRPDRRRR